MNFSENECWLLFGGGLWIAAMYITRVIARTILILDGKLPATKLPKATLLKDG